MDRSALSPFRTLKTCTLAGLLVLALFLAACAPKDPGTAATDLPLPPATSEPATAEPLPPQETQPPQATDEPAPPTDTPAGLLYGRWVPDLTTITILINNPGGNQMCQPDANYWMPVLVISEGSEADAVVIEGLVEEGLRSVPLDPATMTMTDFITYPGSTESSINTLRLEADGRLYHEEQDSIDGVTYCASYVYYVRADE